MQTMVRKYFLKDLQKQFLTFKMIKVITYRSLCINQMLILVEGSYVLVTLRIALAKVTVISEIVFLHWKYLSLLQHSGFYLGSTSSFTLNSLNNHVHS